MRRQQVRKDPKALGQNLYDSLAMIYSYTKQIPTSASILASLHPSHDASPQNEHSSRTNGHDRNTSLELTPSIEHISLAHVNAKPHTQCEHSQMASDKAGTGAPAAQVVQNGRHIHRIPYHPLNNKARSQSHTDTESTPSDAATTATMLSISKSGRKSFTIGGANPFITNDIRKTPKALENPKGDSASSDRMDNSIPVLSSLSCSILDELKEDIRPRGDKRSADFNHLVDFDGHRPNRRTKPIINRSLFYTLSDPETLLSSFRESSAAFKDSPLPHLDSHRLVISFRDWSRRNGALIFDSLYLSLEALFAPPPELTLHKSPRLRPSIKSAPANSLSGQAKSNGKSDTPPRYLSTEEAAHVVMICIHALTSSVRRGRPQTWAQIRKLRSWGIIVPHAFPDTDTFTDPHMEIIDELEYEPALRLASRLCRAIGTRCCFEHILHSLSDDDGESQTTDQSLLDVVIDHLEIVERVALVNKRRLNRDQDSESDPGWTVTATFVEWLRTVLIKEWDSKAEINKWTSVGTAVIMLDKLRKPPISSP